MLSQIACICLLTSDIDLLKFKDKKGSVQLCLTIVRRLTETHLTLALLIFS